MAIRLPGVIVRIVPEIGRVTLPAFPRYVCIVAQGEHRLRIRNEAIVRLTGINYDFLPKTPVDEILLIGNSPDASDYLKPNHWDYYIVDGVKVGILWNNLTAAKLTSVHETFDLSVKNKLYLSIDGRAVVSITITGIDPTAITAEEVCNSINSSLIAHPEYGTNYGNVAQLTGDGRFNLLSVVLGESGKIILNPGTDDCSEILFGDLDNDGDTDGLEQGYIIRGSGKRPNDGETYFVTYRYIAPDTTYEPQLYFDLEPLMKEHGDLELASTPPKLNPLVAMAKLAFQDLPERIPGLVIIQLDLRSALDPYNPSEFILKQAFLNAISKLERVTYGKLYLVPDSTDPDVIEAFVNHTVVMSNPEIKAERMLIISLPKNSSIQDYISPNTGGPKFFSSRVMLFYPPEIKATIDLTKWDVPGYYAGLVYASRKTALPVGTPINMSPLVGIDLKGQPLTYNEKKALLGAGIAIVDEYAGNTIILHGITTRTDYVVYEEENVMDIADYVKAVWRLRLEQNFLNLPINETTLTAMNIFSRTILDTMIRDRVLSEYRDISIKQDPDEPRMIRIRGRVKPMFHVLYVDVEFVFTTSL